MIPYGTDEIQASTEFTADRRRGRIHTGDASPGEEAAWSSPPSSRRRRFCRVNIGQHADIADRSPRQPPKSRSVPVSGIPSDIAASSLQAGYQAREAAKIGQKERSGHGGPDGARTRRVDDAGEVVETSDNDTQVYADAEGAGSQGRSPEDEIDDTTPDNQHDNDAATNDADPGAHLDLQA